MNQKSNELVRKLFNDYWIKSFKPNLRLVAGQIGISYYHLIRFKNGLDMSEKSLNAVLEFLQQQQQQVI